MNEILIPHEKVKAQRIKKDRLIAKKQQEINKLKDQLTTANKRIEVYKEIIERFCDNVNYYERELAGSWMEIRTDAEQALAKSEQIGETE